jgi:hypothetical protein
MKGPLAVAVIALGWALLAYPVLGGVSGLQDLLVALVAGLSLGAALATRRWLLVTGWGAGFLWLYLVAIGLADAPPPPVAPLAGVALLLVVELFDRFVAADAAGPGMDPLGPRQMRSILLIGVAGAGGGSVVLLAAGLIGTTGPLPLAIAGLSALAATAGVVLLSGGGADAEERTSQT